MVAELTAGHGLALVLSAGVILAYARARMVARRIRVARAARACTETLPRG